MSAAPEAPGLADRPRGGPARSRLARIAAWAFLILALLLAFAYVGLVTLAEGHVGKRPDVSREVVDTDGVLLRPFPLPDGRWRLAADTSDVDPRFLKMLLAYEDKRFFTHSGVDLLALGRAALQALTAGEIVSGGSTLTMQVARLRDPPRARTLSAKLRQMVRALELEEHLTKDEVLCAYLTLAPYGGNIEGVRAASLTYFGKEPRRLSLAESALLVALPQSPEARRPDRNPKAARAARDRVLDRLLAQGVLKADEVRMAKAGGVPGARRAMPQLAPHLAEQVVAERPKMQRQRLTLDADLQARLETLVAERTLALGRGLSAALLVVDNDTAQVRAYVGSADFSDRERAGAVDLARAVRSPGSTLKPFIYALAFDDGIAHPETLIEDTPARFGTWRPENFDLTFQGTVSVRKALQLSLNVPAVRLLDAVTPQRLATRLKEAGARLELPAGAAPALPMGLGGVGIRLTDLAMLYSALARGGEARPLVVHADGDVGARVRPRALVGPVAAFYVDQCLLGTPAPANALTGRIAFKTGTSYGYRDSWAIGFDGRRTIAVWVGRPDAQAVPNLTGRNAAAPLLFDAFARITRRPAPLGPAPEGALMAVNARLPPPQRHFGEVRPQDRIQLIFPPDGARLETQIASGPAAESGASGLPIKVEGGAFPLTVLADGLPVARSQDRRTLFWMPGGRGFVRLTVVDAKGLTDSVTVRVE